MAVCSLHRVCVSSANIQPNSIYNIVAVKNPLSIPSILAIAITHKDRNKSINAAFAEGCVLLLLFYLAAFDI